MKVDLAAFKEDLREAVRRGPEPPTRVNFSDVAAVCARPGPSSGRCIPRVQVSSPEPTEFQAFSTLASDSDDSRLLNVLIAPDHTQAAWLARTGRGDDVKVEFEQRWDGVDSVKNAAPVIAKRVGRDDHCDDIKFFVKSDEPFTHLLPLIRAARTGCSARQWLTVGIADAADLKSLDFPERNLKSRRHGMLPPEHIQSVVRAHYGIFRTCYEDGLRRNRKLTGRVVTRFVIDTDGRVAKAKEAATDLPDPMVVQCIVNGFSKVSFEPPAGAGVVTVVYPIMFSPGD